MIRIGTDHFKTMRDAQSYYAQYGYSERDIEFKRAQGDFHLGKPPVQRGQRAKLDGDKRYYIEDDLSSEQRTALEKFHEKYGRQWKEEMLNRWLDGRDAREPGGHALRQIRNQLGPQWLEKF